MSEYNLTDLQRHVMFENGTECAFDNEYWDNKRAGIYVDITNGIPLFSSEDKFDSGTGWPSFTKPIKEDRLKNIPDYSHGMNRIEARTVDSNIHLGHVFNDGPPDRGGKRYCINSAALKFIPKEDLIKEGYDQYASQKAVLAGGCFWGMAALFSKLRGVSDVVSGYTGGTISNPTYEIIRAGRSYHAESIELVFDPAVLSYEDVLKFFFKIHDPTTRNQQGNDIGTQYRSAIFYLDDTQKKIATQLIHQANQSDVFPGEVVTQIEKLDQFYPAEDYHQAYLEKNPGGYNCHYIRDDWVF